MAQSLMEMMKSSGQQVELSADMGRQLSQALDDFQDDVPDAPAGLIYMNFSGKMGVYKLGPEKEDVTEDDLFILDPSTCFLGFQCWKASTPVDRVMWSAFRPGDAVDADALPDHGPYNPKLGEGWRGLYGFICCSVADPSTPVQFTTDSKTGKMELKKLFQAIATRLGASPPEPCWPVIAFGREKFQAQGQWNFKPLFKPEVWTTVDKVTALATGVIDIGQLLTGKALSKAQVKKLAAVQAAGQAA